MEKEHQLYELGYHLVPTVGDEGASSTVAAIQKSVTARGGEISKSAEPALMDLSYAIEKRIDAKKKSFNNSYFGWMNIYMDAEAADQLQQELRANDSILRHLLIKKDTEEEPEEVLDVLDEEGDENTSDSEEVIDEVSDEEVDKAIDDLVAEE